MAHGARVLRRRNRRRTSREPADMYDQQPDPPTLFSQRWDGSIVRAFETQAEKHAASTAVHFEDEELSYADLNRAANGLADLLLGLGLAPGGPVAICCDPSLLTPIAVLGALKAGGAYVPISSTDPAARIDYVLRDTGASVLLTESHLLPKVAGRAPHAIALDRVLRSLGAEGHRNPELPFAPERTAYVLYTSGSSGEPKGVMVPHEALSYYLSWHCEHLRPAAGDIDLPLSSSTCFAAGVTQLYTPLLLGRTLHVFRRDSIRDPAAVFAWYAQHPEHGLYCVPTLWSELVAFAERQQSAGHPVAGPRCVLLSGEPARASLVQRSVQVFSGIRLFNLFGPTEATANASACELRPGEPVTIGKPLAGTRIYLVDEELREVAPGEAGELCISGPGVATGYLNLPELTRQRFVPDPFTGDGRRRMFRTGDLAAHDKRGDLVYLGRRDFQVKVRGFRVECGEIEEALARHPAVRQAVVVCREGDVLEERSLVAYVCFQFARYASIRELRASLAERLPDYMIPAAFVVLDDLPKLANGKVDRKKLPAPGRARPDLGDAAVAPRNVREAQILRLWEETLGLEELGVTDDFFELGGNSLTIAAAITRLRETLHVALSYADFFAYPTPAALAAVISGLGAEQRQAAPAIVPLPPGQTWPCADNQRGLWHLARTFPGLTAYNVRFSLRFEGRLDGGALVRSLGAVVARHAALRTAIVSEEDGPATKVLGFLAPALDLTDLSALSAAQAEREAERLATADCRRPFTLDSGPLVRFSLHRLARDRHRLYVTAHHIVFDGRSIGVFCRELLEAYRACRSGRPPVTAPPAVQYHDWVAWQRSQVETRRAELAAFWQQALEGSPQLLNVPSDYRRPVVRTFQGGCVTVRVGRELKTKLETLARSAQVTPFMVLFAAFGMVLGRYTGEDDFLVGCPVANRQASETESLIGFFTNTIVLRVRISRDQPFRRFLERVRETCLRGFEMQSFPFESLVEALRPARSLGQTPIFQVMFAYHERLFQGRIEDGLTAEAREHGNGGAKHDLVLDAQDLEQDLELRLTYDAHLFAVATAERFLHHYVSLLAEVAGEPDCRLEDCALATPADLADVQRWNATGFANARRRGLHRLFEEQAARTPEWTALIAGADRVTYEELNRRAAGLARCLLSRGVGPGDLVGVHLEASAEMVVALLAILKAGAAYVPLDPYYPQERIDHIIQDSGVRVIVTERRLEARLAASDTATIPADEETEEETAGEDGPAAPLVSADVEPHALMYVMYTSGSTGRPKGVMVPHVGACNYVLWMQSRFPLAPEDRVLSKTSINFDISVWEIFLPLISGATLVVGRREELEAPDVLAALLRRERVTVAQFVPSALRAFVDSGKLPTARSLRCIFSGGEALAVKLQEDLFRTFSGELHNLYGPTEASIYVGHWSCRRGDRLRTVPIGRPVHNTTLHILDASLRPVPVGMIGEVYIGGAGVARGYWRRPEQTAAAFVPDPWTDAARLFKTGDLARFRSDGALEFLGRADRQVKVRGYRIELGEIEHHLNSHPEVQHAVIVVREDEADDVRLVAYLLYREKGGPDAADLRAYLKTKLPDYMVPSTFVTLDSIPLLPNDKADIKALPKPEFAKKAWTELDRSYQDDRERALAVIWEEVLGTGQFGLEDSFFAVGGHSLLIARLGSLIEQRLAASLSNIELFQFPTIRSLARHLARQDQPARSVVSEMARRAELRKQRWSARIPSREI